MLTPELIKSILRYNSVDGTLVWIVTKSATAPAGSLAGSVNSKGHVNLQINKKMYSAHQVVYMLHHGHIPKEIDHRNGVKTDNRIENLRPCTSTQNKGNIGLLSTNRSGYKGVSFNTRSGLYHAQIKIHGKQTYLGRCLLAKDAARLYNQAAIEHFGEFAYLNDVS